MVLAAATDALWVLIPISLGALCAKAAADKRRNPWVWGIVGFLIPIVGLLFVALLPRIKPAEETV
jgi:dipeptide/tripeptide permease